jgi:hypothetical protein
MKKTILFAFALIAILFTADLSAQVTRPGGGTTSGGSGTGAGSQGGGSGATSQGGSKGAGAQGAAVTYPKVYVLTPAATGGTPSRRLLAGNLFKGKDQGIDLTFDVLDPKGAVVTGALVKEADGNMVIDAGKLKSKTGNRLRVKGKGTAVEFYPF